MKYTYELLIQELEKTYQLSKKENGKYVFEREGYTKERVAKELFIDSGDLGYMIKNEKGEFAKTSRTATIKVLIKQGEILALEKKVRALNELNENLQEKVTQNQEISNKLKQQVPNKTKSSNRLFWIKTALGATIIFFTAYQLGRKSYQIKTSPITEIGANKEKADKNSSQILNPSFEIEENDRYYIHWANTNLGNPIQVTANSSDGKKAAKLPKEGDRIGYQTISVSKNTDYILSFDYLMQNSPSGNITISILAGEVNNPDYIKDATIASLTLDNQSNSKAYQRKSIKFNSSDNSLIAIYFSNVGVQCNLDAFELNRKSN